MSDETKEPTAMVPVRDAFACAFDPADMHEAGKMANWLAQSTLIPDALRGKAGDVLVVMMTGRELGLSTMQALRNISVIKGKSVMSAELMVAKVVSHAEVCTYFHLIESTEDEASYKTLRVGSPEPTAMRYTKREAALAGLADKPVWQKHPAAMLRARCSSALARAVYPDLVAGIYEPGEGEEIQASVRPVTQAEVVEAEKPLEIEGDTAPEIIPPSREAGGSSNPSPGCTDPRIPTFWAPNISAGEAIAARRPAPSAKPETQSNEYGEKTFTDTPVPGAYWKIPKDERRGEEAQKLLGGPEYCVGKNEAGKWMICLKGEKVPF